MYLLFFFNFFVIFNVVFLLLLKQQESPADASAIIPRWPSAAILDIIGPEIAPFDPPTPKTLA